MHSQTTLKDVEFDCLVLLTRALFGKTLACFGADGFGQYGSDQFAHHHDVVGIAVTVTATSLYGSAEVLTATAHIKLLGYDSRVQGHVATDRNLEISVNKFFRAEYISPDCWTWAPLSHQTQDCFAIELNVEKFLGW